MYTNIIDSLMSYNQIIINFLQFIRDQSSCFH